MSKASFVAVQWKFILKSVQVRDKVCDCLTWFLACLLVAGCNCLIAVYRRLKGVFEKANKVIPFQGMDVVILFITILWFLDCLVHACDSKQDLVLLGKG